ncbi:hypothetical protein CRPA11_40780 [Pseudomonas aeruginosa]
MADSRKRISPPPVPRAEPPAPRKKPRIAGLSVSGARPQNCSASSRYSDSLPARTEALREWMRGSRRAK